MTDYIELGSAPHGEDCAQVGSDNYEQLSRIECFAYVAQLSRMFPKVTWGFIIKRFPHDFGSYREVCLRYHDETQMQIAFDVESNLPEYWDEQSKVYIAKRKAELSI